MFEQLTEAHSVTQPTSKDASPSRLGRVKGKIVSAAANLVNATAEEPSGWYVHTGEGVAVSAGSDDLERVDVAAVLGSRFALALDAVVEVNSRPDLSGPERFLAVQNSYSEKLALRRDADQSVANAVADGVRAQDH